MTKGISEDGSITTSNNNNNNSNQQDLPEINEQNSKILRTLIHQQLDEIRTGNAYVEHELQPDCFDKLLTDDETFEKFETMTGKKWMEIEILDQDQTSLNGGKLNKKRKQYVTAIRNERHFVRMEIDNYTKNTASLAGDEVSRRRRRRGNDGEDDTVSSLSESKVSSKSDKRKKKHKKSKKKKQKEKKKSKKSKKRKRDGEDDNDNVEDDEDSEQSGSEVDTTNDVESKTTAPLTASTKTNIHNRSQKIKNNQDDDQEREERRKHFEEEKEKVLSSIPKKIRKQFREPAFGKWGKEYLPALILGPYDVAPGPVRMQYMNMMKKVRIMFILKYNPNDVNSFVY